MNSIRMRTSHDLNLQQATRVKRLATLILYALFVGLSLPAVANGSGASARSSHADRSTLPKQPMMRLAVDPLQKINTLKKENLPMMEKENKKDFAQTQYGYYPSADPTIMGAEPARQYEGTAVNDSAAPGSQSGKALNLHWSELPMLPNQTGVAGAFVGISGNALIVTGGANFPDGGAPWKGSKKVWYDSIYVLNDLNSKWQVGGHLPRALGYGVTVNWNGQMIIVGGSNEKGYYPEVWKLKYTDGTLSMDSLPALPTAMANMAGALVGDCIYIAGGQLSPESPSASKQCWRLDLHAASPVWEALPAWPGEGRMLSVAGAMNGKFYLFSGTALRDGKRVYLKDAYCYDPRLKEGKEAGWQALQPLPNPVVAAPGPAFAQAGKLFVFGGDDGGLADQGTELKDRHPGFSSEILAYNPDADKWTNAGSCWTDKKADAVTNPNGSIWAPVTTGLTIWNGAVIIAAGEVRPSTRTPRVLMGTLQ